jgi:hypothetical protein
MGKQIGFSVLLVFTWYIGLLMGVEDGVLKGQNQFREATLDQYKTERDFCIQNAIERGGSELECELEFFVKEARLELINHLVKKN